MLAPTPNDVLSGRGHSVNYHPGNEAFRRMLELHMAAYSAGTKKQKMMISRTIVDDIYSKEPPGRFLKECPDTRQWIELSRREAADKAAQAMAYTVRNAQSPKRASKKRKASSSPSTTAAALGMVKIKSSSTQRTDQSLPSHANLGYPGGSVAMSASSAVLLSTNPPPPSISSLQQQIPSLPLQQSSTSLPPTSSVTSELVTQLLLVTQQQQQQIQQQQLVLSQLLASLTEPAPAPPISAPTTSLVSAPMISSSAQGGASFTLPNTLNINNDILRQIIGAAQQGNIGTTGLQPASLTPQSQANLQLANPSNQSSVFGGTSNPNPLAGAHEQHELDQVYRASMVQNQFNQSLLMSSPPNSMSSNTAASFQQQSQPQQQLMALLLLQQNYANATIRSPPRSTSSSPSNKE